MVKWRVVNDHHETWPEYWIMNTNRINGLFDDRTNSHSILMWARRADDYDKVSAEPNMNGGGLHATWMLMRLV